MPPAIFGRRRARIPVKAGFRDRTCPWRVGELWDRLPATDGGHRPRSGPLSLPVIPGGPRTFYKSGLARSSATWVLGMEDRKSVFRGCRQSVCGLLPGDNRVEDRLRSWYYACILWSHGRYCLGGKRHTVAGFLSSDSVARRLARCCREAGFPAGCLATGAPARVRARLRTLRALTQKEESS